MHRRLILFSALALLVALGLGGVAARRAQAQLDALSGKLQGGGGGDSAKITIKATIEPAAPNRQARLVIAGQLAPGWHTYSIAQAPGGPVRSKIKLPPSDDYRLLGDFKPDPPAEVHEYADIWPGLKVEEHSGKVTWSAPIEIAAGVDVKRLEITGAVFCQICAETCLAPRNYDFVAHLAAGGAETAGGAAAVKPIPVSKTGPPGGPGAGTDQSPTTEIFQASHSSIRGQITPSVVAPGGQAQLVITAEPEAPWYLYALADHDPEEPGNPAPTLIELESSGPFKFGRPTASIEPASKVIAGLEIHYHAKEVSWSVPVTVPADVKPGDYPIAGLMGFMNCTEVNCDRPTATRFSGTLRVAAAGAPAVPLQFSPAKYEQVRRLGAARLSAAMVPGVEPPNVHQFAGSLQGDQTGEISGGGQRYEIVELNTERVTTLPTILLFSFLGGLILNVMPCVLPVIGLKILSFVEQGGQSHARILLLNVVYAAGMMAVFLVLATLAVTLNLGWGEHFNSLPFAITLTAVVFAMALSFLGVWEIPIPGFVGSGASAKAMAQGGLSGAFAKGAITTVLATPCSGPYLGSVFTFLIKQPPATTYLVFAMIGFGMSAPYLLIGAFPKLVAFLPKPGAWMDTLKQFMGFILLGTVVFLMQTIDPGYFIATFALLIGIWAACWWIGRMPITLSGHKRLLGWLEGSVVAVVVGSFAFTWLVPHKDVLPWQQFSRSALNQLTSQGKTVLVDFTADWCLICKTNLRNAIDTEAVLQRVKKNGVVPLLADWSDGSDEIRKMLADLSGGDTEKASAIPLLAIFPADQPGKALVLRAIISQSQLLDALAQAGPSRAGSAQVSSVESPHPVEPVSARR